MEQENNIEEEKEKMKKRLHEINTIYVIDTHKNMSHYRVMEAKAIWRHVKNKRYLVGVKPNNCNVKLDFGGVKIPILDKEVSLLINMHYPMTCHDFDIWMTPIDTEQDYSIELKYTDNNLYTSQEIRDVKNEDVLAMVIQMNGMFGIKNDT